MDRPSGCMEARQPGACVPLVCGGKSGGECIRRAGRQLGGCGGWPHRTGRQASAQAAPDAWRHSWVSSRIVWERVARWCTLCASAVRPMCALTAVGRPHCQGLYRAVPLAEAERLLKQKWDAAFSEAAHRDRSQSIQNVCLQHAPDVSLTGWTPFVVRAACPVCQPLPTPATCAWTDWLSRT
jgi:hypothetical protein